MAQVNVQLSEAMMDAIKKMKGASRETTKAMLVRLIVTEMLRGGFVDKDGAKQWYAYEMKIRTPPSA